jgi:hypothetical protein
VLARACTVSPALRATLSPPITTSLSRNGSSAFSVGENSKAVCSGPAPDVIGVHLCIAIPFGDVHHAETLHAIRRALRRERRNHPIEQRQERATLPDHGSPFDAGCAAW